MFQTIIVQVEVAASLTKLRIQQINITRDKILNKKLLEEIITSLIFQINVTLYPEPKKEHKLMILKLLIHFLVQLALSEIPRTLNTSDVTQSLR